MINKKMLKDNQAVIIAICLTVAVVFFFQGRNDDKRREVPQLPEAPAVNLEQLQREGAVPLRDDNLRQ